MSSVQTPAQQSDLADQPASDLDRLLRAYFQAELPEPWPGMEPPVASASGSGSVALSRRWRRRSRLALAACITLLLLGHWFLAGLEPKVSPVEAGSRIDIGSRVDPQKDLLPPDEQPAAPERP